MLFLSYWELKENMPAIQHVHKAKILKDAGLFSPEGVEIIRFDKTPDNWGIKLFRAVSAEAAHSLIALWRVTAPGFFKKIKMLPALPVKDAAASAAKLYQSVKEAEITMK